MLESLAAASYDGRLYSLSSSTGDKECTKDSCRRLGARTLGCERVCIFAVREQSCVALRRTCAALLRAARSPQTRETVLQRDALEAASCVLRTSTESTVLQGCLMRVAALTTLVAGARAVEARAVQRPEDRGALGLVLGVGLFSGLPLLLFASVRGAPLVLGGDVFS